jgi:hypothetical protein
VISHQRLWFITVALLPSTTMNETTDDQQSKTGLRSGVTSYGDEEFALFLRKAFIKGAGCKSKAVPAD